MNNTNFRLCNEVLWTLPPGEKSTIKGNLQQKIKAINIYNIYGNLLVRVFSGVVGRGCLL